MDLPQLVALRDSGVVGDHMLERVKLAIADKLGDAHKPLHRGRLAEASDPRSETAVRVDIMAWAWSKGASKVLDTEQNRDETRVTKGTPDVFIIWKPEAGSGIWLVEVKSAIGTQSIEQREVEACCVLAGVTYLVARNRNDMEERWKLENRDARAVA
jgi:hypothetical protein